MEFNSRIPGSVKENFKKFVDRYAITTNYALADEFEKFTGRVTPGLYNLAAEGRFYCHFPFNPECKIYAEIGHGNVSGYEHKPTINSGWIFMKALPNDGEEEFSDFAGRGIDIPTESYINLNPQNYYHKRDLRLNKAEPGFQALADRIETVTERRLAELKACGDRCARIYKFSAGFISLVVIFAAYLYLFGK